MNKTIESEGTNNTSETSSSSCIRKSGREDKETKGRTQYNYDRKEDQENITNYCLIIIPFEIFIFVIVFIKVIFH